MDEKKEEGKDGRVEIARRASARSSKLLESRDTANQRAGMVLGLHRPGGLGCRMTTKYKPSWMMRRLVYLWDHIG